MASEEQPSRLQVTVHQMIAEGKLKINITQGFWCHDCKRKLGTYQGERYTLVPRTEAVEADILCDQCRMKRNTQPAKQERQTKLGEVLTEEAGNQ